MPFNDTISLFLARTRNRFKHRPWPLDIFHQTLGVSDDLLRHLLAEPKAYPFLIADEAVKLLKVPEKDRKDRIELFYRVLGFESWNCIDSHETPHGTVMDWNMNFSRHYNYKETFDLVVNNGSTEHIFDQRAIFENIHNLCRRDGIMLHKIPTMEVMNIGYYGCSVVFFIDLAEANRYEILDLRLSNRWGDMVRVQLPGRELGPELEFVPVHRQGPETGEHSLQPLTFEEFTQKSPLLNPTFPLSRAYNALIALGKLRRPDNPGEIFTLAAFQKKNDDVFEVPFQGKYLNDIESEEMKARYKNQFARRNTAGLQKKKS